MEIGELLAQIVSPAGGVAAIVGGLAGTLGSIWQKRLAKADETSANVDLDLRSRRIEVYKELWVMTRTIPKWPRNDSLQYADLETLAVGLRDWYFSGNGMFLSRATHRDGYSPLQEELSRLLKGKPSGKVPDKDPDIYEKIRSRCSKLRTELTFDIESRSSRRRSPWFTQQ